MTQLLAVRMGLAVPLYLIGALHGKDTAGLQGPCMGVVPVASLESFYRYLAATFRQSTPHLLVSYMLSTLI